ncbi:DNA topoisomerase III [Ruficoccus amylovorans]|uniref:DNA topoisomerase n=1 Tax=Ruficoccus amylovorans TaxID=1804625 RepID=A0A842HH75_9BACT|nr:DNA topoisomerase III [Ruficoccus amylovorans]MBC2594591.1 DNA topoisomerase III [Ruficoccus amylovorans]
MKTLVIAEKPSVAGDLARVLGRIPRKGDHYENDEYIIDSAVGHLVELIMPEDISPDYKRWTLKTLPIVPKTFKLRPIDKTKKKFQELKKHIARDDVGMIINACDAGREGELIFTYIMELAKGDKKDIRRLWMSSMTPQAIRDAFSNLRSSEEMQPLQDAARSRSEADWLIGINGTRGATVQFGRRGGTAATVGRVQTPTLTLVYERECEIRNFKARDYWRILGNFNITAGAYDGVYQKPDFKKADDEHDRADRLWDKEQAERILLEALAAGPEAAVTEEKKRTRQASPRLYDLTTLQREANSRFGFPAGMTLNIAQALYEKHKMITYPRTDSRALPEDYGHTVRDTLASLPEPYAIHAEKVLANDWVVTGNKRIFNNKQVSDHFAIIPTNTSPKKLQEREQKIYDMITRRFMAVFFPPAEYDVTTRMSELGGHAFKTEGKVLAVAGWLEAYGKGSGQGGEDTLPALSPEDGSPAKARLAQAELQADQTRPPPRYTEATLLAAMEGAGKFVEDEELREALKERGLGTPATRAATIDHLVKERYIEREGRDLAPTHKAEDLVKFLRTFKIDALTRPELTGEWEHRLRQIEEGTLSRDEFMKGIASMTEEMINNLNAPPPAKETHLISPLDKTPLLEDHRAWFSQESVDVRGRAIPKVSVNKVIGNRKLDPDEVEVLLDKGEIGPLDGFKSRMGKAFSAVLKLAEKDNGSLRVELDFGDNGNGPGDEDIDLSQFPVVGTSPVDNTPVHETPNAYISEGKDAKGRATFRMSRNMLGKALPAEQIKKLLTNRKTDLIQGFRSNRTKRLFDAFLILQDDGGIKFEFPPRPAKKAAKKAAKDAPSEAPKES